MRRLALVALGLLALPALAPLAAAESGADDEDTPRQVSVRLDGELAVFTARYELGGGAPFVGEALVLPLPSRGVVIGARVRHDGVTQPMTLRPADRADRTFEATWQRAGRGAPSAAVLLTSASSGAGAGAVVHVATATGAPWTLELDVAAPTCLFQHARHAPLLDAWAARVDAVTASAAMQEACDDFTSAWVTLPAPAPRTGELAITGGRLALGAAHVAMVEVGAGELGAIPPDLATVILVDGSRSMSDQQRQVQRQLVAAYARAAPAGRLQLIAFARTARALLPAWTPAAQAAPAVERALTALTPANGSNVDAGLAEAAAWLGPTRGARRVIVLTDELLAERLTAAPAARLGAPLPADALVHVVAIDPTGRELDRDDEAVLAPLAAARAGISLRIGERQAGQPVDALRLARPTSLDRVEITAPGWTRFDPDDGPGCVDESRTLRELEAIPEGAACRWWARGTGAAGAVTIRGWLWGRRVERVVTPAPGRALTVARLLSTATPPAGLRTQVERAARALNAQWSLLATWGGDGGVRDTSHGGVGYASPTCCGSSTAGTIGHGGPTGTYTPPDDLGSQVRPRVASCGIDGDAVAIELELTRAEIVDVRVTLTPDAATTPDEVSRRRACVEAALWDMAPVLRTQPSHQTLRVRLTPSAR